MCETSWVGFVINGFIMQNCVLTFPAGSPIPLSPSLDHTFAGAYELTNTALIWIVYLIMCMATHP